MNNTTNLAVGLVAAIMALAQTASAAPADTSTWRKTAAVELQGPADRGLARIDLPAEVFDASPSGLADVRLVDAGGAFVPCIVRQGRLASREESVLETARLLNATFLPEGGQSQVTADFGKKILKNEIFINTAGDNFRRRVQIEAGNDGENWQVLRQAGWLFRIADLPLFDKQRVDLPPNDFRYLRVTVFNGQDEKGKIEITTVAARNAKIIEPELAAVAIKSVAVNPKDENAPPEGTKDKKTVILLDCGYRNLPLAALTLAFDEKNFMRTYAVQGRNQETETITEHVEGGGVRRKTIASPWNLITQGTIHRFTAAGDTDQSLEIALSPSQSAYRYLRIEIVDRDNAPLTFTGATVQRAKSFALFQAKAAQTYRLLVGDPAAGTPQYDLEHYADKLTKEGLTEARLAPLGKNPEYKEKVTLPPWSERYKTLLWGVLIVIGLVLLIVIVRKLKSIPPQQ